MIQWIYGRAGSGKTALIEQKIADDAKAGHKVLLLVPEQQVFESEKRIALGQIHSFSVEVVGFSRLCNLIFRRFGGLCYHYIGRGAKLIVMWRTLRELSGILQEYGNVTLEDLSVLSLLQRTLEELERCQISPQDLERLVAELGSGDAKLKRKLHDLAAIYQLDLHLLSQNYDNPEEDLPRAVKLLKEQSFFEDMRVYIDGFDSFTSQEADMLSCIFRQAENVTVSIPSLPHDRVRMYEGIRYCERLLQKLASDAGCKILPPIVLNVRMGCPSDELRFLTDHIWNFGGECCPDEPKDLTLTETSDIYQEVEAVARAIARLVQDEGIRYREIAVIMRSTPDYEGILDQAFEKYHIPCFSSTRTKLRMKPQIRMILSVLAIGYGGWRTEDVISYLRCSIIDVSAEESDLLEDYASLWKISGRQWYAEDAWNMNPSGFSPNYTEEDHILLQRLETIRKKLVAPVSAFLEIFRRDSTVKEISEALFDFLLQVKVPDRLSEEEELLCERGEFDRAQESRQVWDVILSAMDSLVTVAGDMKVNAVTYANLLSTVFDSVEIGKIPARVDEVIVGDPGLLHRPGIRHAFLLGLCEGVFPKAPEENPLLGDSERERMEDLLGVSLEDHSDRQAVKELYGIYRAVSFTGEKLHLFYHSDANPSIAIFAIRSLFPKLTSHVFVDSEGNDFADDAIRNVETAFSYAAEHPNSLLGQMILQKMSADPVYAKKVAILGLPIGEQDGKISERTVTTLMKNGLNMTQSRLDRFVKCPFSYYARYVLKIREPASDDFEAKDIGDFIHSIFETFLSSLNGHSVREFADEELKQLAESAVQNYRSQIVRGKGNERLEFLFDRLSSLSALLIGNLISEFRDAQFEPRFFELPIDHKSENVQPLSIDLGNGHAMSLYGRVDRVDLFHSDGNVYVRVVDYKTGSKSFSMKNIRMGLDLQLLLYLYSICETQNSTFLRSAGVPEGGQLLPAGALYYSAAKPLVNVNSPVSDESRIRSQLENEIHQNGLLLSDEKVLRAMDSGLSGRFIPITLNKDGSIRSDRSLISSEEFSALLDEIKSKLVEIGQCMESGDARANPLKFDGITACTYCHMKKLCRISENMSKEGEN